MKSGWQVGVLFGIPLYIDASWFFVIALFTYRNGSNWQWLYPDWGSGLAWGTGLAMALLLFASVLLHELGHSLVARAQGLQVSSITLFLFGGIASIEQEPKTPGQAFQVAVAGPLVSLGLFGLLTLAHLWLLPATPLAVLVSSLASVNLALTLFNLLPGLPLDGGQILKAAVWRVTGNRFRGVHWAARVGQILGWLALIAGVSWLLLLGTADGLWLALLGWFGIRNASSYNQFTNLQEGLAALSAADALNQDFRVVDGNLCLREFAERYLLAEARASCYFAAADGRYRGLVRPERLNEIERSLWDQETVQALVTPLSEIPTAEQTTPLIEVIHRLETDSLLRLTILTPAGAVAGVVDRGDTLRALAKKMNWAFSEADIRRIKEEGRYPPGLQLGAIAQMLLRETRPEGATPPVSSSPGSPTATES